MGSEPAQIKKFDPDLDDCPVCNLHWKYMVPDEDAPGGERGPFSLLIGVEYDYTSPNRYDGISEWVCPDCKTRWGRWTGRILQPGEEEPRYGGRT